jgi:Na+/H+-dicarboxylate symporter
VVRADFGGFMNNRFTLFIVAAMILGIVVGLGCNAYLAPDQIKSLAGVLGVVTDVFLRLIKMIIAPLVFSTLVAGIAHMEDAAAIGRVGAKTMVWFIGASLVSLTLGLVMVNLLQPGSGLDLKAVATAGQTVSAAPFDLKEFVGHIVPTSIFQAMANNEILQIVVFSCFVGTAIAALDDGAPQVLAIVEQAASIMLKVTGYVMKVAPLAVFAAIASTVATQGAGVLATYAKFVGDFYLALLILWAILFGVAAIILRGAIGRFIASIRQPAILAFSTSTSEAAYPSLLEGLQAFGLPRQIVTFVLPLGYSFNLVGTMIYCTFATIFIAQAYHVHLSAAQQIGMLLLMMITSKGVAGVPRAALVVVYATLPIFHIPEAGLLLVLAVDHLLDMGRSCTNVIGNSVVSVAVAAWEGRLGEAAQVEAVAG